MLYTTLEPPEVRFVEIKETSFGSKREKTVVPFTAGFKPLQQKKEKLLQTPRWGAWIGDGRKQKTDRAKTFK